MLFNFDVYFRSFFIHPSHTNKLPWSLAINKQTHAHKTKRLFSKRNASHSDILALKERTEVCFITHWREECRLAHIQWKKNMEKNQWNNGKVQYMSTGSRTGPVLSRNTTKRV